MGPYDLSISLGIANKFDSEKFKAALDKIIEACKENRMPLGIFESNENRITKLKTSGFTFFCLSSDISFLINDAKRILINLKGIILKMNQYERLKKISSSSLADADKSIRCLSHDIVRFNGNKNMIGQARVVQVHNDFLGVLAGIIDAKEGEVLVVNASATYDAVLGGLFSTEAERKGLAGIVVDGLIRDLDYIRTLEIPVYAKGSRPSAGSTNVIPANKNEVFCGGVRVTNGDILVGDGDGVVVIESNKLDELIDTAFEIEKKEELILEKLKKGVNLASLINVEEHIKHLKEKKKSTLKVCC